MTAKHRTGTDQWPSEKTPCTPDVRGHELQHGGLDEKKPHVSREIILSCLRVSGTVFKLQGGLQSSGNFDERQISRS